MWTKFWDMHSGGSTKQPPYNVIYIELPEKQAIKFFKKKFKHNPRATSCPTCGENYSIDEKKSLEVLSGYHRSCLWDPKTKDYVEKPEPRWGKAYQTLEQYRKEKDVLIISKEDIAQSGIPVCQCDCGDDDDDEYDD